MQLYKRGTIWWARVRDERGRFKRVSTHCRDYEAAKAAARELELRAASPAHAAAAEARLDACVKLYFDELARRKVSESTLAKEQTKAGHLVRLWPFDLPMAHVTAARVHEYIATREGEGVSSHTVKMELQTLRRVLLVARHLGLFAGEIDRVMPLKYGSKHQPRKRAPTLPEVEALLRRLEPRRAAHLAFIVATGARLGESERACAEDVSWERGVVHLRGTKTERSARDVPITPLTEGLLRWAVLNAPARAPLFHPWGKLHRDVHLACSKAEIAPVTPNDLRRSFATWHRAAGVDVSSVAAMLGHATDKLAQTTYARLSGEQLRAIVGRVVTAEPRVPDLYLGTGTDGANQGEPDDEPPGKTGTPGKSRTCDQRFRNAVGSARVTGEENRRFSGVAPVRPATIVPNLTAPSSRAWVHEATANLYELLAAKGAA